MAAALLEMGVDNLAANMELRAAGGRNLHEIDPVANRGGRLVIFDCRALVDLADYLARTGQTWGAFELDGKVWLRFRVPTATPAQPPEALRRQVEALLGRYGHATIESCRPGGNGRAVLAVGPGNKHRALAAFLNNRLGKPLVE